METGNKYLNFPEIKNWSPSQERSHEKLVSLEKFEVLLLDCNQVEGFPKSVKLETVLIWGMQSQSRDICMELGQPLTGHRLASML